MFNMLFLCGGEILAIYILTISLCLYPQGLPRTQWRKEIVNWAGWLKHIIIKEQPSRMTLHHLEKANAIMEDTQKNS